MPKRKSRKKTRIAPEVSQSTRKPRATKRGVVYLGVADTAKRIGAVTGDAYVFGKDSFGMPVSTNVDERDYPALVAERGKGCARRDPEALFMSKLSWDTELQLAKESNR